MVDTLSKQARSALMAKIRSKDTAPELIVRRYIFSQGYRYRLYEKSLPGSPDMVFKKYRAVLFVHGCFWHGHKLCRIAHLPKSHDHYWRQKIARNQRRDKEVINQLREAGWRVLIIWECALQTKERREKNLPKIVSWLHSKQKSGMISG